MKKNINNKSAIFKYISNIINFSHILNVKTTHLGFNKKSIEFIYKNAVNILNDFINSISNYISFFNEGEVYNFKIDYLNLISKNTFKQNDLQYTIDYESILLCVLCNYRKYSHSEYLLWYCISHEKELPKEINFISYYSICSNCEVLWSGISDRKVDELHNVDISSLFTYNISEFENNSNEIIRLKVNVLAYFKYFKSYNEERIYGNRYFVVHW